MNTLLLVAALACAVVANAMGRRLSGGLIGEVLPNMGTQFGRGVQAMIAGWTVYFLTFDFTAFGVFATTMVGAMISGYPRRPASEDPKRGTRMVPITFGHVVGITAHNGVLGVGPVALFAALTGQVWWWLAIAALMRGPLYWAATLWQPRWRALGVLNKDGVLETPPLAELYVGAAYGAALVLTYWPVAYPYLPVLTPIWRWWS